MKFITILADDDGVYYYIGERLKLEGETERRRLYEGVEMHDSGGAHGHSLH